METRDFIAIACGRTPAELVLKNAQVVNLYTGEISAGDVAIADGRIAGVGHYSGAEEIDLAGKYVTAGFIDSHLHIESTMLTPAEFLKIAISHGTTTFVCDPHEIANVCGFEGIDYMIREASQAPADVRFMLPSCVPATPFEDNGCTIDARTVAEAIEDDKFLGLGEFMDYPGVIFGDVEPIAKLDAAARAKKIVDGHSMLSGMDLNGYAVAGIRTDHECTDVRDMKERIERGIYVQIREGSATRNLEALVKGLTARNLRRCLLCTDDRTTKDLLTVGHLDKNVRLGISCGVDPVDMLTMASLNAAECYGFSDRGAVAPGLRADLVVLDDLTSVNVEMVFVRGKLVARSGKPLFSCEPMKDERVSHTMNFEDVSPERLALPMKGTRAKVMKLLPKNVLTESLVREVRVENGRFAFGGNDVLKLAVVERHHNTGKIGLGLIEGYGLKGGAAAITVSHDSHNLIAVGDSDESLCAAINHLKAIGGGMVLVRDGRVVADFPLEVGGLMSRSPAEIVNENLLKMTELAHEMGVNPELEPFMCLSFLSLAVIPSLKITTRGLFDVEKFRFTSIDA